MKTEKYTCSLLNNEMNACNNFWINLYTLIKCDNMIIYIEKKELKDLVMIQLYKKMITILYICIISFTVISILNYVFNFIEWMTLILIYKLWVYYFDFPNNIHNCFHYTFYFHETIWLLISSILTCKFLNCLLLWNWILNNNIFCSLSFIFCCKKI